MQICKIIQKINQLEDESLKENLLNILKESDLEETSSEEESEEDLELDQIETYSSTSSESEEDNEYCLGVDKSSLKNEFIEQLNDIITKEEKSRREYILLKLEGEELINRQKGKEKINEEEENKIERLENPFINILSLITTHKWNTEITLILGSENFNMIALIDSRADINCIQEGLIPTKYYEKTLEGVTSANGTRMHVQSTICKN
ncbi:hypothetical protein CR513_01630, partial [Mucuna pruriens]